jgi:hypothetical protein
MRTLIKTLSSENGEIYAVTDGRRVLLARCKPKIEIYEHSRAIGVLGSRDGRVKTHANAVVICPDPDATREIDADFLRAVSRFELIADIQRGDGVFERIVFDALAPDEIDLGGDWIFELVGSAGIIRKLTAL